MRRTSIRRVSERQRAELAERARLKAELMKEWNGLCQKCGQPAKWPGIELVHIIPLSASGRTGIANCQLWCHTCHARSHHERIADD